MPPSTTWTCEESNLDDEDRWLVLWVRALLMALVLGLGAVFGVAWWLNPYEADGTARRMATHQQLGLPPCTFVDVTGIPCPACGMTTSFALFVRGAWWESARANWVGTLLAGLCAVAIPWSIASMIRGRVLWVGSLEKAIIGVIATLLTLLFLRWGMVLVAIWMNSR